MMLCMVVVKSPPTLLALPVLVTALSLLMAPNGLTYVASADIVGPANASATIGTVLSYFALLGVVAPISFWWLVGHAGWEPGFAVLLACAVLRWLVLNPLTRLEAARWVGASR